MAVSLAILEIFSVKEWPDLVIWVWDRSSLGAVSYPPSIVTMAPSGIVCESLEITTYCSKIAKFVYSTCI